MRSFALLMPLLLSLLTSLPPPLPLLLVHHYLGIRVQTSDCQPEDQERDPLFRLTAPSYDLLTGPGDASLRLQERPGVERQSTTNNGHNVRLKVEIANQISVQSSGSRS